MKILAFSDVHTDLAACERIVAVGSDADLVIGAGDFAQRRDGLAEVMDVLKPLASKAIYVPGNNETFAELVATTSATVLHGTSVEIDRRTIFGIGAAVPPVNPAGWTSYNMSEDEAAAMLAPVEHCDILVSHSPPWQIADKHKSVGHIGSKTLLAEIDRLQPGLFLCGHVHDCWGQEEMRGKTRVRNLGPTVNWFEA